MNAEWPTARLQMDNQPRPPGYRRRYPTDQSLLMSHARLPTFKPSEYAKLHSV